MGGNGNAQFFCVSYSQSCILETKIKSLKSCIVFHYHIRCVMVCKIGFKNWNAKIAFLRAAMVVNSYIKLFQKGADRLNDILMSLLFLVAETKILSCAFSSDILYFQIFWIISVSHSAQKKKNWIKGWPFWFWSTW